MSQRKHRPSMLDAVEHRKNEAPNNNPGFQTKPGDVFRLLKESDRPLSTADIQLLAHHEEEGVRRRINKLLREEKVEKRNDGPDGRVVYYQPKGMEFQWGNDES